MDACIRIVKTPFPDRQWSFQLEQSIEKQLTLTVRRTDLSEGWCEAFFVKVQNHLGEYQHAEVIPHETSQLTFQFCPYMRFRSKPERQFWKIPTNIFQTWKEAKQSPEMTAAMSTFQRQSGYTHICWTDIECITFLLNHYGERYAKAYNVLVPGAFRADFWRYCMLYAFGGVYSDVKATLLRPLDEIIRPDDELIVVRDVPSKCLLNGFIACKPKHPLIGIVIDMVLKRIEARDYGTSPLDVTGPHVFGKAFCRWMNVPEDALNLEMGSTHTVQMLGRSDDKKYIISPEGERLLQKEYDSYYKTDVDVSFHYPRLWHLRAIYGDQHPWNGVK